MATKRRKWFALWTEIIREPWPYELKATLAMLGAHMVDRWAVDGCDAKQATRCRLTPGDIQSITGCSNTADGIARLRALAKVITIKLKVFDSGWVELVWPKFAENLEYRVRNSPLDRPRIAPSSSSQSESEEEGRGSTRAPRSSAPQTLSLEDWKRLSDRLWGSAPWLLDSQCRNDRFHHCGSPDWIEQRAHACLAHFGGTGKLRPGWVATVAAWILKDDGEMWTKTYKTAPPNAEMVRKHGRRLQLGPSPSEAVSAVGPIRGAGSGIGAGGQVLGGGGRASVGLVFGAGDAQG